MLLNFLIGLTQLDLYIIELLNINNKRHPYFFTNILIIVFKSAPAKRYKQKNPAKRPKTLDWIYRKKKFYAFTVTTRVGSRFALRKTTFLATFPANSVNTFSEMGSSFITAGKPLSPPSLML